VVLSHGHLDHSGYLPLLVKHGFRGRVHCTPGTADLLGIVLRDSARLQVEDAERANRHGYSKHHPALPLYTEDDVQDALRLVRAHGYGDGFGVGSAVRGLFRRAGHILGAATVELSLGSSDPVTLVFSGDLGRWGRPILRDPELVPRADVLLLESTYGDRRHTATAADEIARVVKETAARGGAVVVPAFAIGRTQELLWTLRELEEQGRIPLVAVYTDSPMAASVTEVYGRHPEDHDLDMRALVDERRNPLSSRLHHVARTSLESKALNGIRGPMVIIAGSGMATGGRVLHHLEQRLPDHRNTVLLVGYQAEGTRGRALLDGARELKIHGSFVPVRARVESVDGLSAHADQDELVRFARGFVEPPGRTYVVHGEPPASAALAERLRGELGFRVTLPTHGATVPLERASG